MPHGRLATGRGDRVIQVDRREVAASPARAFAAASDVERWPEWLPHYRWVRFHERRPDGGVVEMAAWRPFGPLNYPTWWLSDMTLEREVPRIRFRHLQGITRDMDVAWDFEPRGRGALVTVTHRWDGPDWPLIRRPAAEWVIGPVFVHGIARRTLAGIARVAEAAEGA